MRANHLLYLRFYLFLPGRRFTCSHRLGGLLSVSASSTSSFSFDVFATCHASQYSLRCKDCPSLYCDAQSMSVSTWGERLFRQGTRSLFAFAHSHVQVWARSDFHGRSRAARGVLRMQPKSCERDTATDLSPNSRYLHHNMINMPAGVEKICNRPTLA